MYKRISILTQIKIMSYKSKGDKLCNYCFEQRKNIASKTETENIMSKNWGLLLIPIVSSISLARRANKCDSFPDGYDYHIYIDGYHEEWSKHLRDGYCSECDKSYNIYYRLESSEIDIASLVSSNLKLF